MFALTGQDGVRVPVRLSMGKVSSYWLSIAYELLNDKETAEAAEDAQTAPQLLQAMCMGMGVTTTKGVLMLSMVMTMTTTACALLAIILTFVRVLMTVILDVRMIMALVMLLAVAVAVVMGDVIAMEFSVLVVVFVVVLAAGRVVMGVCCVRRLVMVIIAIVDATTITRMLLIHTMTMARAHRVGKNVEENITEHGSSSKA
mmetsp:Transcript_25705/g.78133  ORF Transcript_25705/g.78133 Transcript_25705/m.78133 type:complete len:201 (-) Transcript_25705:393-995(-)|eukprot:scaffold45670_cov36-Tisochrysis_lutea.AAC.1